MVKSIFKPLSTSLVFLAVSSAFQSCLASPAYAANLNLNLSKRADPPSGCGDYDFAGWTKGWADTVMSELSGSQWDSTNWHNYVGYETMLDYIWANGLKGSDYEKTLLEIAPQPNLIGQSGDSHDDALWGALVLMKLGDYQHDVNGDEGAWNNYYDQAIKVIDWVAEHREDPGCAPGVFWTAEPAYRNTVTNGLWMHANLRAKIKTGEDGYLNDALDILNNFFDKYSTLKNGDGLYVDGLNDDCTSDGHPQVWTYNQGVILSSLGMLYQITKDRQYIDRGNDLINAVRSKSSTDGILAETLCDDGNSCNFDQEGFKGIFMKHMQYFYDSVGRDSALHDASGSWHTDWIGLNTRGVNQYAVNSDKKIGSVWYESKDMNYTPWTMISGLQAGIAATKWGTCS